MYGFSKLALSMSDCLESFSVNGMKSSFSYSTPFSSFKMKNAKLNRLQTMAKLGENLYELKIQMLDLSNQLQKQQTAAEKAAQEGALDMDLKIYYDRMKEAEIQQRVLQKSSRTIVATISSLESQENVEKIKKVLHYTIETHKMAKNNMMEETTSEELLAGFETISSTIDEERMVLDNLDNHITELRTNPDEMESAEVDSNFLLWKNKLKLGKTNQLQTEKKQQEENILAPATLSY